MQIEHSVILVTAAGSPMGRAMSLHFASLGARVALVDINAKNLAQTHRACLAAGGDSQTFLLESIDEQSIADLFNQIQSHYGVIDVLINYWLGSDLPKLFSPASVEKFSHSMNEVATTLFTFGKEAANHMREHKRKGVIVNLAANHLDANCPASGGTTAVISGLTQSWAKELAQFQIRVGGIAPLVHQEQRSNHPSLTVNSSHLQYEIARSTEYIVANDYFNGRMLEADIALRH